MSICSRPVTQQDVRTDFRFDDEWCHAHTFPYGGSRWRMGDVTKNKTRQVGGKEDLSLPSHLLGFGGCNIVSRFST